MTSDEAESAVAGALAAGLAAGIMVQTGKYREGDQIRFDPRSIAVVTNFGAATHLGLNGTSQTE